MIHGSLTSPLRLVASKRTVLKSHQKCVPSGSRPKSSRNIAISASNPESVNTFQGINRERQLNPYDITRNFKLEVVRDSLNDVHSQRPQVWANYFDFCSQYGPQHLSLELHRIALRKCVPSPEEVRIVAMHRLKEGQLPSATPNKWESRLKIIIRWIYISGSTPSLQDFHFILRQFAAIGDFHGSRSILQELKRVGIQPNYFTYGLCLQCISHRLCLPVEQESKPVLISEASALCIEILEAMSQGNVPCTSVNLDLCVRILKESVDVHAFEKLLEIGYGISLSFPDQPPLKSLTLHSKQGGEEGLSRMPFSAHALNTTLSVLGQRRLLSKMVSAFEVLTKPLDSYYSSSSRDFDDDDDWPSYSQETIHKPPHAEPNTTTYNFLIKYLAHGGSFTLARHYILEAFYHDELVHRKLREDLETKPIEDVEAPSLTVNKRTLLPILGLTHRMKHLPLLEWVVRQCEEAILRKEDSLTFLSKFRDGEEPLQWDVDVAKEGEEFENLDAEEINDLVSSSKALLYKAPLKADLDAPEPSPTHRRPFDLDLHLKILTKDRMGLHDLLDQAIAIRNRISVRIKERLRRRIWDEKDIYLVSVNDRVLLPKESWDSITIPQVGIGPEYKPVRAGLKPKTPYFSPSYGRVHVVD